MSRRITLLFTLLILIGGRAASAQNTGATNIGLTTAAACTGDANCSLNGHVRFLDKMFNDVWDSVNHRLAVAGILTHNGAAPVASSQVGVLGFLANASHPSYTEGRQVLGSLDLFGSLRATLLDAAGNPIAGSTGGNGPVDANTNRTATASDSPDVVSLGLLDNAVNGNAYNITPTPGTLKSGSITSAMTGTTSTAVIAAQASNYLYATSCSFSNDHASVSTLMKLQDGSGGTELWRGLVPFGGGREVTFPVPLKVPTLGNGLYTVNVTTGSSTYASCSGWYSTVSY